MYSPGFLQIGRCTDARDCFEIYQKFLVSQRPYFSILYLLCFASVFCVVVVYYKVLCRCPSAFGVCEAVWMYASGQPVRSVHPGSGSVPALFPFSIHNNKKMRTHYKGDTLSSRFICLLKSQSAKEKRTARSESI